MAKIMLVDDAAFMRMMLKTTLTQAGYTDLVEAEDGAKAVELYSAEKPDLVFMDITMPNKDGLETLKEIKGMDPNATIVKSGAKDFIVKPFKPERILSTVKKILG